MNSAFSYYGGKRYMVKTLIPRFPEHFTYVEVFGGSGVLLLNKKRSKVETYNDINEHLVDFFRVIQDEDDFQRFVCLMETTPYSRIQHGEYRDTWRDETDRVKRVHKWYVVVRGAFNGIIDASWSYAVPRNKANMQLETVDELLPKIARRIRCVQLDCRQWHEIVDSYDTPETFFYMDPPYVLSARTGGKVYTYEMEDDDHEKLVERLKTVKGKVMLSGYDNEIYNQLDWETFTYDVKLRAPLQAGTVNPRKKEKIWVNYSLSDLSPQQEMF